MTNDERIAAVLRELERRRIARPLDHVRWLPGQRAFLESTAKRKLFRAGSQSQGKTWAGAAELIWRMLGAHPFRTVRDAPIRAWVVCGAGEQSQIVQQKIWALVPKDELAPGCEYDERKGAFLGKYPKLILKNGSVAWFKSGQGDGLNLASGTLDYVWIDEPPESQRVYAELLKRLLRLNGDMALTLTPVNRPVDWLQAETEAGRIVDIHYDLRPEHMIPVGYTEPIRLVDGTVCDAAWIERIIAETPAHEVPVTIHGGWEMRVEGGYFDGVWDPNRLVYAAVPEASDRFLLGIDHGAKPGKQIAVLMAVNEEDKSGIPFIYCLDEYVGRTGRETPEDDARGILTMLRRHGLQWHDLQSAEGDRPHAPGRAQQKSNLDLEYQIAKVLGIHAKYLRPRIRTAKRGEGRGARSVGVRSRWLHHQMVRECFAVHPRCERVIEAMPKYTGRDDDWKDPIDAIVYGCDHYVYRKWQRSAPKPLSAW